MCSPLMMWNKPVSLSRRWMGDWHELMDSKRG
jgi:hypothetical protein